MIYESGLTVEDMAGGAFGHGWATLEAAGCASSDNTMECLQDAFKAGLIGDPAIFHIDNMIAGCGSGGALSCSELLKIGAAGGYECNQEAMEQIGGANISCDCETLTCLDLAPKTPEESDAIQQKRMADVPTPPAGALGSLPPGALDMGTDPPPAPKIWPWVAAAGAVALGVYLWRRP